MLTIDDIDIKSLAKGGGKTGSVKVKSSHSNDFFQLKFAIFTAPFTRRVKADFTDRENFGEVIASKIISALVNTPKDDFEFSADVSFVYDAKNKRTNVASKYLKGDEVRTLDSFVSRELGKITLTGAQHVKFVDGSKERSTNVMQREFDISGPNHASLRRDIARGLAVSMLIGDHDVNPGNFVVVSKMQGGKKIHRAARIDYGHAFNDLLNAPRRLGGQVRNKDNRMLDFLNRRLVAGIKLGAPSKLWRDYPGMVPSQEMADSLLELSSATTLNQGIVNAKLEFQALLQTLKENHDENGIKHLTKTLNAICKNLTGSNLAKNLTADETLEAAFSQIENYVADNQNHMKDVARLMQLQVNIDNMIAAKQRGEAIENDMQDINDLYEDIKDIKGLQSGRGIKWIKTEGGKSQPFKGDLKDYIHQRENQLGYYDTKKLISGVVNLLQMLEQYDTQKISARSSNKRVSSLIVANSNHIASMHHELRDLLVDSENMSYKDLENRIQKISDKYLPNQNRSVEQLSKFFKNKKDDQAIGYIDESVKKIADHMKQAKTAPYRLAFVTLSGEEIAEARRSYASTRKEKPNYKTLSRR